MVRNAIAIALLVVVGAVVRAEEIPAPVALPPVTPQAGGSYPTFAAPQNPSQLFVAPAAALPLDAPAPRVLGPPIPRPIVPTGQRPIASAKTVLLQQKLAELEQLQQEVRQLRAETRTSEQILARVQMLEFSLTKMRKVGVDLPQPSVGYFSGNDLSHILRAINSDGQSVSTPHKANADSNDAAKLVDWLTGNNVGKIVADPTIVMLEGRPAQFHVGGEVPVPAKDVAKAVEYQPIGTQVDLLATSQGDDRVRLELRVRVSEVDKANSVQVNGVKFPALRVRQMATGIESTFGQASMLTGMVEKRIESVSIEDAQGKRSVRSDTNEIGLMLVVTAERVETPDTARAPSPKLAK